MIEHNNLTSQAIKQAIIPNWLIYSLYIFLVLTLILLLYGGCLGCGGVSFD